MLPATVDLVPGIVSVNPVSSGGGTMAIVKVTSPPRSPSFPAVWDWGIDSESLLSKVQWLEQTETATNYADFDCLRSLPNFCCEMKVAESLCKLLTSNRCRTTFFKYASFRSVPGMGPLISEMTELPGAGCRCRSLAVVWILKWACKALQPCCSAVWSTVHAARH